MRQQLINGQPVEFYNSEKYSSWVLATGQNSFQPFANTEAENLRNYSRGQNLFSNNQGRILALQARIHAPNFGRLSLQDATSGALTIADDLNAFLSQARIEIRQDSKIVHEGLIQNIAEPLPFLIKGEKVGTPTNAYNPISVSGAGNSSLNVKRSIKNGVYFTPPLMVSQGRTVSFSVSTPSSYTIPAGLNNHIVQFILFTEEIPQANLVQARQ